MACLPFRRMAMPDKGFWSHWTSRKGSSRARTRRSTIRATHTKVHHVLYPLYYWPGMDATIEAVCTACAKCIRANRRRKKLNLDFNPASQKELLLPRQRYGIDFYGVHNGEILVMVDLFSRETMLEFLPDRKMERVCQAIMKRIIFSRGVNIMS